MRYSDWALGEFFKKAKKTDWYQNTIFVITADHSRGISNNFKKKFNIPLLIFSPSDLVPKGVSYKIGSHIDLAPTILAFLKNNQAFVSSGKNLLTNNTPSFTLVSKIWNILQKNTSMFLALLKVLDFKTLKKINNPSTSIHQEQKEKFLAFLNLF